MPNTYDVGDQVRVTGTFTSAAGVATDPTAVFFDFRIEGGAITTYTYVTDAQLVKAATGVYYVDLSITAAGTWYARFRSTGTGQAAGPHEIYVRKNNF